jgi:2'-5' RNA ligase
VPEIEEKLERLFFGIPVPERTAVKIAAQLPRDIPGRFVATAKWHFTLRFVGSVSADQRDRLANALSSMDHGPSFHVRLGKLGAFPNPRRARVLWVGITQGEMQLERIARKVEEVARMSGLPPETRPFRPHLTIARIEPAASLVDFLRSSTPIRGEMEVREVVLYRSAAGRYEPVAVQSLLSS